MAEIDAAVLWHDLECGAYSADLDLWRELADELAAGAAILDLGAGTGRVALDLAARGASVTALDRDPRLLAALERRAAEGGTTVATETADACAFELAWSFELVLAPMQLLQIVGGAERRAALLGCVRRQLAPGGVFAAALTPTLEPTGPAAAASVLPDVREQDGWVFSSTPTAIRDQGSNVAVERLRETVGPNGELSRKLSSVALDRLDATVLAAEADACGFSPRPAREVPATDAHVGSTVAILE